MDIPRRSFSGSVRSSGVDSFGRQISSAAVGGPLADTRREESIGTPFTDRLPLTDIVVDYGSGNLMR